MSHRIFSTPPRRSRLLLAGACAALCVTAVAFAVRPSLADDGDGAVADPLGVLLSSYHEAARGLDGELRLAVLREWAPLLERGLAEYPESPYHDQALKQAVAIGTGIGRHVEAARLSEQYANALDHPPAKADWLGRAATLRSMEARAAGTRGDFEAGRQQTGEAARLLAEARAVMDANPALYREPGLVNQIESTLVNTANRAEAAEVPTDRLIELLTDARQVRAAGAAAGVPEDELMARAYTHYPLAIHRLRQDDPEQAFALLDEMMEAEGEDQVTASSLVEIARRGFEKSGPELMGFADRWITRHPDHVASPGLAEQVAGRLNRDGFHDAALRLDRIIYEKYALALAEQRPEALEAGKGGPLSRVLSRMELNLRRAGLREEAAAIRAERAVLFPVEIEEERKAFGG